LKTPQLIFLLVAVIANVEAQTSIKANVGVGYLEHFAVGTTLAIRERSSFTLSYGSNFFYKPRDFSTLYAQYDRVLPLLAFGKVIPGAGLKAGQSVFTDNFYKWKVNSVVPFMSVSGRLSELLQIGAEAGLAISRIQSVTRISYGEIGKYKRYLPEVKLSLRYRLLKLTHE
jgi:hypothetical protein